jgi:uncharacterized protein
LEVAALRKIIWSQANGLRQYASAFSLFGDTAYRGAAKDIHRYMTTDLITADGVFRATQDAVVDKTLTGRVYYKFGTTERQKLGRVPRIGPNICSRENGWAISALAAYANATGEAAPLTAAERAADWIIIHRRGSDGVFRHGDADRGGPYLGDTIAMGAAPLDLYAATGKRKWLDVARDSGKALAGFRDPEGGFATSKIAEGNSGVLAKPFRNLDEHVQAARFARLLWRYVGDPAVKDLADHAVKYLASETVIESGRMTPAILLVESEQSREPTHITIVGHKDDPDAISLHAAALKYPALNKRVDWWDTREGPLPNPDVTYPEMDRAAAFACSNRLCSLPAFSADQLNSVVKTMLQRSIESSH